MDNIIEMDENNNLRNPLINAIQNPWRTLSHLYNSEGIDESLMIAQLKVAGMCSLTSFSFKYATFSTPAMIKSLKDDGNFQWDDDKFPKYFHGVFYLGCIFAVILSLGFNLHNGKRKTLLKLASAISLIGWFAMLFSESFTSYLVFRFPIGFGMGLYSVAITYYVYESIYVNTKEFRALSLINSAYGFIASIMLTLLVWLTFNIMSIKIVGCCLHIIVFLILRSKEMFPESPYFLYREKVNCPEIAFEEMIAENAGLTKQLFIKIRNDVRKAKDAWRRNISLPIQISLRFIMHEMTGITIYCSFVTHVCEGCNKIKLIFLLILFIYEWVKNFNKSTLMVSSILMAFSSFALGGSFFVGIDLFNHVVQYTLLMCCFYSYIVGWMNSQSIIFDDGAPYYKSFNFVVIAMLCKFCTLLILTYTTNWSLTTGLPVLSIVFGVTSFLAAAFHSFN